jgi:hypothetical protein
MATLTIGLLRGDTSRGFTGCSGAQDLLIGQPAEHPASPFFIGAKAQRMENVRKVIGVLLLAVMMTVFISGCSDATVARSNLERAEQNFEVYRRVVFYNGITGEYILTIEGKLAIIVDTDGDLVVTVKTESGKYLKHYLGLSDNVTYFSEALAANDVSVSGYRVVFKPSVIIPTIELK